MSDDQETPSKNSNSKINSQTESPGPPSESFLDPIKGPEIVFGLVAPVGTDLQMVSSVLCEELKKIKYTGIDFHVSDIMREFDHGIEIKDNNQQERYDSLIKAGNAIRRSMKRYDALAILSVGAIRKIRAGITGERSLPAHRTAYILNQLKRPEEIDSLRKIYGKGFIQISAYCSNRRRIDSLARKIADSFYNEKSLQYYEGTAHQLVVRDADEENEEFGQRVRNAFPLADVVIDAENERTTRRTVSRFIRAFFGHHFITPSKDEYAMFSARAVSLRSSDLSRQVGAVVARKSGEIICAGCNEVPKASGGTYWEDDEYDSRDFQIGYDAGVKNKLYVLQDVVRRIREKWLSEEYKDLEVDELVEDALFNEDGGFLKEAQIMSLLEYGRVVHAEMLAISDAARQGLALRGATLYCTTFPCHNCARHIVASGLERVVYIEPYTKSLAADLYPDSIEIDGESRTTGPKVKFEPFIGIAPERYGEIFRKGKRKDNRGYALKWDRSNAEPILQRIVSVYLQIESGVLLSIGQD